MARDIYEEQEIGLVALLKQGKPAGSKVTFKLQKDGADFKSVDGEIVTDPGARAGKAATTKYKTEAVPPDKPSYLLTYKVVADGEEYQPNDEIRVWPKKGKVKCLKEADGKPFKGFKFKVTQSGGDSAPVYKATEDSAEVEFKLQKGSGFTLESVDPYEIKSTEQNGTALRDLKTKGVLNFEPEFVKPKRPDGGKIRQWINLDIDGNLKGTDGKGNEIEIQVGAKGDRDDSTGNTKPEIVGAPGVIVFVKVTFSGPDGKKSKRNDPKTDLVAGLDLTQRTVVKNGANDTVWEFKGKVDLKSPGGIGKFKVNLGKAGGDTCEIELGSTAALGGAKLTITNWRKIWYELMSPDFMELEERNAPGVGQVRDFAAGGLGNIKASGDKTFVEYEIFKSHSFAEGDCPAGTVMKREFFELNAGNAKVYVLTDLTFKQYPKAFDKGKGARGTLIKACDINLYSDGPGGGDAPIDRAFNATVAACSYDIWASDRGIYWIPTSGFDGTPTIKSITWAAKIANPNAYRSRPTVEFEADEDTADDSDASARAISIRETLQNQAGPDISFSKPFIGHISTDLSTATKGQINGFLTTLYGIPALRTAGNKLKFKLRGLLGNDRRSTRFQNIKDYITQQVAANAPLVPTHPGLKDNATCRDGTLNANADVDMDRSNHHVFAINLPTANPTDPGNFVGALSATKCPVTITIRFEPHHGGNGLAGQGAQKGEILIRWGINCPLCITDTFLHELGHQYNLAVVARGALTANLDNHVWATADAVHAPGMPIPKTIAQDETNNDYKHVGNKGHCYSRRAHSGSHCAWGLTDVQKGNPGTTNGVCTMYGSGPRDDGRRTRLSFCKQCTDYIRGRDLSALK